MIIEIKKGTNAHEVTVMINCIALYTSGELAIPLPIPHHYPVRKEEGRASSAWFGYIKF